MQMLNPVLRIYLLVVGDGRAISASRCWVGELRCVLLASRALTAVVAIQCALAVAAIFRRRKPEPGCEGGPRQPLGARSLIVPALLQAYLPAWTDRHGIWCIDGDTVRWIGVVLFAAGGSSAPLAGLRAR